MADPRTTGNTGPIRTVEWQDGAVVIIDQRRLPLDEVYVRCHTWEAVADAIRTMAVRGAPALGVAAGMGMALAARAALLSGAGDPARFRASLQDAARSSPFSRIMGVVSLSGEEMKS